MPPIRNNRAPRRIDRPLRWSLLLALPVLILACGTGDHSRADSAADSDENTTSGPQIVATTSIWADVVTNVACGGLANVETLIPIGGDPHGFEPSLADRGRLENAALIVANGLLLEEGLKDTLDAVADGGTPVFEVGEHVDTIAYGASHRDPDDGVAPDNGEDRDENDHEGDDPHIWFDPIRVSDALPALADRLVEDAGLDRTAVDRCVTEYAAELSKLDAEIDDLVGDLDADQRVLVTSHDSLGYFADRYGFEVVGTVIPAPSGLAETNPAQLEALAKIIEETGVAAIFAETQRSTDDADALANRVGTIAVVSLPTGTLGGDGADSYIEFMRSNAVLITTALAQQTQQAQG